MVVNMMPCGWSYHFLACLNPIVWICVLEEPVGSRCKKKKNLADKNTSTTSHSGNYSCRGKAKGSVKGHILL